VHVALLVHIAAGGLGLVTGGIALSASKGGTLHRRSGLLFVYAMVTMAITGAGIAAWTGVATSVTGGLLAAYLVTTALTAVRPPFPASRRLAVGAMAVALAVGLADVSMGLAALARGESAWEGVPVPMLFLMGSVALGAGASDLRWLRSGGLQGRARLARHLWRMCFALFIASGSFFLGQADEFPEALRITPLLLALALAPLAALLYWLWRVRSRRTHRGITAASSHEPARIRHSPFGRTP
jgi:uncharacterized membrane protein